MKFIPFALCAALLLCTCSGIPKEKKEPFSVKLDSPRVEAGSTEVYLDGFMSIGGLKEQPVDVYFYPTENAVCLNFKVQYINCNQFWDADGRAAFVNGLEQFKEDYVQRKLVKGKKGEKVYGSIIGFFAWKKTVIGIQAHGFPRIDLGYSLRDNKAFFTTAQREAYYEDPINPKSRNETSGIVRMYFTRAQAEALAALFDEDYLKGLASGSINNKPDKTEQMDEYTF